MGTKKSGQNEVTVETRLSGMIELIDETIRSVRRISSELRPSILDDLGLIAALEWQGNDFSKRTGITLTFTNKIPDFNPDPNTATQVFRIFQESLTNIARHSQATEIDIQLYPLTDRAILEITDNGKGFDPEKSKDKNTLGLLGMKERCVLFEGLLTIESKIGNGTKVIVTIPNKTNLPAL